MLTSIFSLYLHTQEYEHALQCTHTHRIMYMLYNTHTRDYVHTLQYTHTHGGYVHTLQHIHRNMYTLYITHRTVYTLYTPTKIWEG